ncbi:MAG: ArsA family ATPase [Bdellovibrionota bacterium]
MVVCAGSGGVGKTTMSAALGVRAAQLGRRTLVLTVDPAKRLASALGLDLKDDSDRAIPIPEASGSLSAAVIDSKKIFDRFVSTHSKQAEVVERIQRNRLYQQMSTTLAGSQEFTALERLLQSVESGTYDLVILDTPPTKHAMDFLTAPQRINSLFQDAVTKWFLPSGDKPKGFIASLVGRGTRTVLKSLEHLTGGPFIEELIDFFGAVRSIQEVLRERSERAHALLTSETTRFVVVTSFDAAKLLEAKYLQGQLKRLGYRFSAVIINRAFPLWLPHEVASGDAQGIAVEKVRKFFDTFREYYSTRYTLYEDFAKGLSGDVAVVRIPEYRQDVHGLHDLTDLARALSAAGESKP